MRWSISPAVPNKRPSDAPLTAAGRSVQIGRTGSDLTVILAWVRFRAVLDRLLFAAETECLQRAANVGCDGLVRRLKVTGERGRCKAGSPEGSVFKSLRARFKSA
jgi:hypothetical protein